MLCCTSTPASQHLRYAHNRSKLGNANSGVLDAAGKLSVMSHTDLLSNQYKVDDPDPSVSSRTSSIDSGERKLAALGYTQQLNRGFTTFTNFAVSFSIISILTGITGKIPIR